MKHSARILSLLLVLVLVCGLLPQVQAATAYQLWVGGVQVTSANQKNILGNGTASYDPGTKTLTLNKARITSGYNVFSPSMPMLAGIYMDALDLTIKGSASFEGLGCGVYAEDKENTFRQTGKNHTLTVNADLTAEKDCEYFFHLLRTDLIVNGGTISGTAGMTVDKGDFTINGGNFEISCAGYGSPFYVDDGDLTVNGGNLKLRSEKLCALLVGYRTFALNGGTVDLHTDLTAALEANVLKINGGSLEAVSGGGADAAFSHDPTAIRVWDGAFFNGGTVHSVCNFPVENAQALAAGETGGICLVGNAGIIAPENAVVTRRSVLHPDGTYVKDLRIGLHPLFTDLNPKDYFFQPVLWAFENGITKGNSATTFDPYGPCTREQIVTFLWRAAGSPKPKTTKNPFTDVAKASYAYKAILWAVENGITKGASKTAFDPNATCTREQVVTFLWRAAGSPAPKTTKNPFTDVTADSYAYQAVLWAVENGVTKGSTKTTFNPYGNCTRGEIVTFLYRAAKVSAGALRMTDAEIHTESPQLVLSGKLVKGLVRVGDTVKIKATDPNTGEPVTFRVKVLALFAGDLPRNEASTAKNSGQEIYLFLEAPGVSARGSCTVTN